MSKKYEIMLIFSSELIEKEAMDEAQQIKEQISEHDGEVVFEDFWGKRRFAYPIKKQESGYYYLLEFNLNPQTLKEFDNEMRLNKNVLRHLITIPPEGVTPKKYEEIQNEEEELKKAKSKPQNRRKPSKKPVKKETEEKVEKAEKPVDKKELDKKLDKILSDNLNI